MSTRLKYNLNDSVRQIIQIINTEPPFKEDSILFNSTYEQCKTLWYFVKNNIAYKNDTEGVEEIRTPKRTWLDRKSGVDCEDYCIFIIIILLKHYIKCFLRIVSFSKKDGYSHVYVVVKDGKNEIILDCCMDDFDKEMPYVDKIDIDVLNPDYSLIPKSGNYAMKVLSGLPALTVDEILKYEGKDEVRKEIEEAKEKYSVQGKTAKERAEEFANLNYLLQYGANDDVSNVMKPESQNQDSEKELSQKQRIRVALALAKARARMRDRNQS